MLDLDDCFDASVFKPGEFWQRVANEMWQVVEVTGFGLAVLRLGGDPQGRKQFLQMGAVDGWTRIHPALNEQLCSTSPATA